jgi:hypothetical protein
MANTTFIDNTTVIYSSWLNDINNVTYNLLGNGTVVPTTKSGLVTSIGALAVANNLSDLASASTARTNLGLGSVATYDYAEFALSGANSNITSLSGLTTALSTGQGGTGLSSFTANKAVYATSTSALTTGTLPTTAGGTGLASFTANGAVYASSTSALTTGTLPIASGGTNASTSSITSLNNITGYNFAGITGNTSTYNLVGSNTPTLSSPAITGGTLTSASINSTSIGATTASTGKFTTLEMTSVTDTSSLARNTGLTSVTTIANTTTFTTGGLTLLSQTAAAGSVWRVRAYGQFTAASSGTVRSAQIGLYWGGTQLAVIAPSVLLSTAQTTQWQVEFGIAGTSTTALWTTGILVNRIASATVQTQDVASPNSYTVTAGAQTLDLQFRMSSSVAGDQWTVHNITFERLK